MLLHLTDQPIQLLAGADVERAEPLEEVVEVLDRRVPEDLRLAVFLARQPFGEMRDQFGQFGEECLLGQVDRFIESCRDPLALLAIQFRAQLPQIFRRFDAGEIPLDGKQASRATAG